MRVAITFGPNRGCVRIHEPTGVAESRVHDADTASAIDLLDHVIASWHGSAFDAPTAADLVAADRDRILAAVYELMFGPRVESTVRCVTCKQPFDVDFVLRDLIAAARPDESAAIPRADDGTFTLADGRQFRLPTGRDELAVLEGAPESGAIELLRRCVVDGSAADDPAGIAEAMANVAPLLDQDVDARCPECGHVQTVHFDLQHYLLTRIANERERLVQDVHRLATAYHWARSDILELPRSQRRAYVGLVERELALR